MSFNTYAEINLDNLAYNIGCIRERVTPAALIPVVKADAYGHGAVPVAKRLAGEGCTMFAVARLEEAMDLRESGISQRILLLGRLFPPDISQAVKAGVTISIFGPEDLLWVEKACQGAGMPAVVHLKIDSGMGRVGVLLSRAADLCERLSKSRSCLWEGIYSHFSTSDEKDKTYATLQLSKFRELLAMLPNISGKPQMIVHMAASGAILELPDSYFNAVRPGILMYGHYPSKEVSRCIRPRQVMSLKTHVAHVREMPGGCPVSYGRRWVTPCSTRIGVLPIGYADGISRRFTNNGEVLIRGRRYPIVGTVTMDCTMVNIADGPVGVGDEALLWGESTGGVIEAIDVAERIGTIPYELTCAVSGRVPRVYVGGR